MESCLGVYAKVFTSLKYAFQQVLVLSYVTIVLILLGNALCPKGTSTHTQLFFISS